MNFHDELTEELKKYGVDMLADDKIAETFRHYVEQDPLDISFFAEYGNLALVFFYEQSQQPEELRKLDGLAFQFVSKTGAPPVYAIGISKAALDKGAAYLKKLWAHECAHVLHGIDHRAHDSRFREILRLLDPVYKEAAERPNDQKPQKAPERAQERSDPIHM